MNGLEAFLEWAVNARGLAPSSVSAYRRGLEHFSRELGIEDPRDVTLKAAESYMARLFFRKLSENTRGARAHAIRSFFHFLGTHGFIDSNPMIDLRVPERRILTRIPTFTEAEIERLIFQAGALGIVQGPKEPDLFFARRMKVARLGHVRDTALLGLMYVLGLRASEPALIAVEDYSSLKASGIVLLRGAKRSLEPVPMKVDPRVHELIVQYLEQRERFRIRSSMLFPPLTGAESGLGRREVSRILERRIRLVGIEPKGRRLSPHAIRYSIATHLYRAGFPPVEIQSFMRHRSLSTTMRYISLGSLASVQRKAIRFFPWNTPRLRLAPGPSRSDE